MLKNVAIAVLVLLPSLAAGPARAAGEDLAKVPQVADALAAFDVVVEKIAREREQPGLSVGLVYGDRLIWAKGYGWANLAQKTPATPATAYRIASITKLFTATAILQLRDAGKLRLDDPVARHLPWFAPKDSFADDPPITIRNLMTHTSGLMRELDMTYWDDGVFPDHETLVRMVNEAWTVQPREMELKYSNVAVALEGEIVAAVSGEPWADYVKAHILDPLGMTHTAAVPRPDMPALTTGYLVRVPGQPRRVAPFLDKKAMSPCGSIASPVEDLARFVSLQFADTASANPVVLKGSSLREMHRVQFLNQEWTRGYGLGWQVRRVGDQLRIQHGGSVPGNLTMISAAPAEKFGVIVLTNADDGKPDLYVEKAWSIVAPAVKKAMAAAGKKPVADPTWSRYAGDYEWVDGTTSKVLLLSDGLVLLDMSADDPWADRIRLEPVSPGVFRLKGGSQQDELVRFESDAAGKVVRLREPGYSARRR